MVFFIFIDGRYMMLSFLDYNFVTTPSQIKVALEVYYSATQLKETTFGERVMNTETS